MYPSAKLEMCLAQTFISGWKALKPARSSAPFMKDLVFALACKKVIHGRKAAATVLLTSFSACLYVFDSLKITWQSVVLSGDLRMAAYPPGMAGVNIHDAKTSRYTDKFQFVKVPDQNNIKLLSALKHRSNANTARIAQISYQQYTDELRQSFKHFQLHETPFTIHSARIGRATDDCIRGEPVEQIAINGRLTSLSSLRYYLNNGRV